MEYERRQVPPGKPGRGRLAPHSCAAQQQNEHRPEENRDQDGRVARVPEVYTPLMIPRIFGRRVGRMLLRVVRVVRRAGDVVGSTQKAVA